MKRVATFAGALILGLVSSAVLAPAGAGDAQDKATETKDRVSDTAGDVKEGLKSAGEKVKEKAVDAKDEVKSRLGRADDRGTSGGQVDVREAQEALKAKGFDPGAIDGVMGPRTRAAVRDFQKQNGLPETGRLDTATASQLGIDTRAGGADTPSALPGDGENKNQTN
jgi:peptidoglycan hydrolase-like protein with peptidoglycan-binding domain